uniref:Interferon induced protein 35 n=1 Tax=Oplegnathus fasciatus TaxID=163134 RepID=A0A859J386_OPLFA|nr:interferon induced protein 35 [Oplegnathus fasciatus]
MSSDEDFSLVTESPEDTHKALISNCKKQLEQLVQEQKELAARRDHLHETKLKFRERSEKLIQALKDDQLSYKQQIEDEKAKLNAMKQDEIELMQEIQKVEAALKVEVANNKDLKQQTDVFSAVPERDVVFTGLTGKGVDAQTFEMKPRIDYPMEGGTALITFDEEVVARKILTMKNHQVDLGGECSINVEARPVHLMLPTLVEIDSEVCPHSILISNLPKMDTESLLNKLEIHFSKRRNGGGEVDECEMLSDSGTVVLTFFQNDIAKGLTDTEYHDIKLQEKKMHRVRVTPFLNGKITNFKTKMSVCPRTVLLTEIPAVMERETLQDLLEIHFQKSSNGGGEIEAFLYNPQGQHTMALFEGVSQNGEE